MGIHAFLRLCWQLLVMLLYCNSKAVMDVFLSVISGRWLWSIKKKSFESWKQKWLVYHFFYHWQVIWKVVLFQQQNECHVRIHPLQSCDLDSDFIWRSVSYSSCIIFLTRKNNLYLFCACTFQRARPKSDQEENELVMASLRSLYEERQRSHQHILSGDSKQVTVTHLFFTTKPSTRSPLVSCFLITIVNNS